MTEVARNPSSYEASDLGRFDVPASAQELEEFEPDEDAILGLFADGYPSQPQESHVDDNGKGSSRVLPWRARAWRTLKGQVSNPKSIMARSASPSVASNSSASAINTDLDLSVFIKRTKDPAKRDMIIQVMKSFASEDELKNKTVKTAEEKKVWAILRSEA
ncbi:hypothetical protein I350_05631 [Cryptococcus amylolentus CBS 6273]|nr:hypothetical protein I350_05631 [Cryptococcus amylolentus CBS 6273]